MEDLKGTRALYMHKDSSMEMVEYETLYQQVPRLGVNQREEFLFSHLLIYS